VLQVALTQHFKVLEEGQLFQVLQQHLVATALSAALTKC